MKKLIAIISALVIALSATVAFADPVQSGDAHVDRIDLRVSEPTVGGQPNPNAFSFYFDPADCGRGLTKAAITWFDSHGSPMASFESFEADGIYTVTVRGSFSDGYSVDGDTVLLVNGNSADPAKSSVSENKKDFTITYTFPAVCGHTSTHIEGYVPATPEAPGYTGDTYCDNCHKLMSTGSVIPQLPKPIKSATFTFPEIEAGGFPYSLDRCSYETDPAGVIDITVCQWYRLVDAERDAWTPHPGVAFREGETYAVEIIGRVHEGYAGDTDTVLVIDGGEHPRYAGGYISSYRVDVTCQWTVGADSGSGEDPDAGSFSVQPVTKINALIDPPKVGQSPSDTVIFESTPEGVMVPWNIKWGVRDESGGWTLMNPDDVFEEGRIYTVEIYAGFVDGYVGDSCSAELYVNGQAADENFSYVGYNFATISYDWPALTDENPNPGADPGTGEPGNSGAPETGDSGLPLAVLAAVLVLSGACALAARRFARK